MALLASVASIPHPPAIFLRILYRQQQTGVRPPRRKPVESETCTRKWLALQVQDPRERLMVAVTFTEPTGSGY